MEVPEDHINFTAKYKGWIVAKKIEIDKNIEDVDVARILISIRETFAAKIYDFLNKDFNIAFIDQLAGEIVPSGKLSGEKVASVLAALKGGAVTKRLGEIADTKMKKEIAKAILVEKVLERMKLAELTPKMIDKYIEERQAL